MNDKKGGGMFSEQEIKRNLLGSLEVALFMPVGAKRFGSARDEMFRSFIVPIILFPVTLLAFTLRPESLFYEDGASVNIVTMLYSLHLWLGLTAFLGIVYLIMREVDRKKYFYQFVTANNWLTVPTTVIFIPMLWMQMNGTHNWQELHPFMVCLALYTYAYTAFMAAYVLRLPWELAGFVVMISIVVNDSSLDILQWVGTTFL